jgi:hypothetical protein
MLRRHINIIVALLLISAIALIPSVSASTSKPPEYWFQVGASAAEPQAKFVTGASVEINIRAEQPEDTYRYYWVGLSLPNDSFIQVGYALLPNDGAPRSFWAYFPPGTAKEASHFTVKFSAYAIEIGWAQFSMSSSGSSWSFYMNQERIGQVATHASNSGENGPGAVAENAGTTRTTDQLGPAEFRNLRYETGDESWQSVKLAEAYVLDTQSSYGVVNPYGVSFQLGRDNYWVAGSNLPSNLTSAKDGEILWPWNQVQVNAPYGYEIGNLASGYEDGWHAYGSEIAVTIPETRTIRSGELGVFSSWQVSDPSAYPAFPDAIYGGNRTGYFTVNGPLQIAALYKTQYELTVKSSLGNAWGSGWFNQGASASFHIQPTIIPRTGLLGALGLCDVFAGWIGDYQGTQARATVTMNSPKTIIATWTLGFQPTVIDLLLVLIFAAVVVALVISRRGH